MQTLPFPRRAALVALVAGLLAGPAFTQPPDNATAARIADGMEKAQAGKLLDAVEQFQRVMDTAGDELVPVDRSHFLPARWVVHGHLARLPAEGVRIYRQRVDAQAARRLDEARKRRDDAGLHRLLADMFVARATEEAILELARRSFERGEFDAAEHYWSTLLPPTADDDRVLRYPDPRTDPAAVMARLILVKLFRGQRAEANADLEAFRQKYAAAAGLLAGKTGKYIDTLTELLNAPAQTTLPHPPEQPGWPTFAGSPTREGTTRARLPYFWPDGPSWRVSLPLPRDRGSDNVTPDPLHRRALAFYPVVADGRAFVADGARVLAIDLTSGKIDGAAQPVGGQETHIPTRHDVRFTLTEAEGILYGRFGAVALKSADPGGDGGSFLLALGPRKGANEERDALWRLDPPAVPGATTHFEGAPVVQGGRLYVGFWRLAGADPVAGVACYRLDEPRARPDLAWEREVGKAGSEPNGETRYRHELVALSGPNVVYCTDGGTVIALDAQTGRPAWEYRYPRNERPAVPRYRDLCPPLADGGRIYAAPADTDRLLCLDAFTGRLIWEREGVEVIHLLGVARGRLIATFGGSVRGIRGLNLRTGADSGAGGWAIHVDGGEPTFGRGLVTEEAVVWPTQNGLEFLDPADGTRLRGPVRGSFGNLCYADGVLLVTTATEVWGYVSEAKKLGERRKAADGDPEDPVRHAELARSLIDAGEFAEAEREAAKSGDAEGRLRWLLAERMIRDGDKPGAARIYADLVTRKLSHRGAAAARLAEMCDDPPKFRAAWQAVWETHDTFRDRRGIPYRARDYAYEHSPELFAMNGGVGGVGRRPLPSNDNRPEASRGLLVRLEAEDSDTQRKIMRAMERFKAAGHDSDAPTFDDSLGEVVGPEVLDPGLIVWKRHGEVVSYDFVEDSIRFFPSVRPGMPTLSRLDRPAFPLATGEGAAVEFGSPRRNGSTDFALFDSRILVARDNGVMWALDARDCGPGLPFGVTFNPVYLAGRDQVVAQLSTGRVVILDAMTGKLVHRLEGSGKAWVDPPVALNNGQYLWADDIDLVQYDTVAGKPLARYTIPGTESLTGEPPRFRMHQGDILVLFNRNYGVEADRLRIDGLKRAWEGPSVLVGRKLDDVAFAGDHFVTAADGVLAAHSWKDGSRLWEVPVPDAPHTRWKLSVSPHGLLVHPAEALMVNPHFDAVAAFRRAGGDRAGLLRAVSMSYDAWSARELPVLVIDPTDGRLVQRLTFPAAGPLAGLAVTPMAVVVVTGKGTWTLNSR